MRRNLFNDALQKTDPPTTMSEQLSILDDQTVLISLISFSMQVSPSSRQLHPSA